MSSKHQNINSSVEHQELGSLSFLDSLKRSLQKANIYWNLHQLWRFYSKIPNRRTFNTLLHRDFSISCSFKAFHSKTDHLKTILRKKIILRIFLNVPKRDLKLQFLGDISFQTRKKL